MAVINEHGEPGAFFICTETSPRCYIIQRVNSSNVNRMLDDMMVPAGEYDTPPTPMLPWWFTAECENQLMSVSDPPPPPPPAPPSVQVQLSIPSAAPSVAPVVPRIVRSVAAVTALPQSPEQIKQQLKAQLEYYFSRENLMTDRFLRCQMDNDQYVPIRIIAGFPKVKRLTSDYSLVVKVLRESSQVQVDEKGERVRAVSKRCTIILREIPESTDEKEVASMFAGGPPYLSLQYGLNNSWYVTFESEEATQRAFLHLQNLGKTFNNKPICARIKTGGAPYTEPLSLIPERPPSAAQSESPADPVMPIPVPSAPSPSSSDSFDLGQILASYGYVPCATFKPGATVVHVTSNGGGTIGLTATNRNIGHQRLRGTAAGGCAGQSNNPHYRGSSSRARGAPAFMYNQRICDGGGGGGGNHRDFNMNGGGGNYHPHGNSGGGGGGGGCGGGGRRTTNNHGDAHRDGYRDRNNDSFTYGRSRGRQNRANNFNYGTVRSRTPVEPQKIYHNDNVRHCEQSSGGRNMQNQTRQQQQRYKQKEILPPGTSSCTANNNKNTTVVCPPIICLPPDDGQRSVGQRSCSKTASDDDSKLETSSSRKTDDTEYSFEESAFPSLSEEMELAVTEPKEQPEKSREKPTFSSVAAGKRKERKEIKERKSYAQTLKQNNGLLQAS